MEQASVRTERWRGVNVGGAQNEVATDEKIEEIFDFLPIVSTLLENMVKSNVAEKPGEAPLRVDVTEKITELKAKIDAAELFLQNLSGGKSWHKHRVIRWLDT